MVFIIRRCVKAALPQAGPQAVTPSWTATFLATVIKPFALDLQHFCNHTKAHGYIVRMTACQSLETNKSRLAKRRFIT